MQKDVENYLTPGFRIQRDDAEAKRKAYPASVMVESLAGARSALRIPIPDARREHP
jgi:hypothetical protein